MNQYNFKIRHRQGRSLAHVDYLSRNPITKVVGFADENPWKEILPRVRLYQETDLHQDLWRPTITKVEGKKPPVRERRTHTNQIWYNDVPEPKRTWETSRVVTEDKYYAEGGLAIEKWWDEPEAVRKYH